MGQRHPNFVLQMQGFHALAQDLGSDVNTAAKEKENFMRAMPGLRKWQARAETSLDSPMLILGIDKVSPHDRRA